MFPFQAFFRRNLPRDCRCGDVGATGCNQIGLRNHRNFPPFAYLQDVNDVSEDYYAEDESGMYSPIRHWAFVGEIVENRNDFIPPRALVETHFGERVPVNFHLEGSNSPTFCSWSDLIAGNTLCLLYAKRHQFMDMTEGIRQENPDTMMIFRGTIDQVTNEMSSYSSSERLCFLCNQEETEEMKLLRCSRCHKALYCGRNCQSTHWKKSHKKLCCHAEKLEALAKLRYDVFENFYDWSLVPQAAEPLEVKRRRYKESIRDFMFQHGAVNENMESRLKSFLEAIAGKDLKTDSVSHPILRQESCFRRSERLGDDNSSSQTVSTTWLYKSLLELAELIHEEPKTRTHVVDLRSNGRFEEMEHDAILNTMFLCIPQWQHEVRINGIAWGFEAHQLLSSENAFASDSSWVLNKHDGAIDIFSGHHRTSGLKFCCSDNMEIVSELSEHYANGDPGCMVIRVLRATANPSYEEPIRKLASTPTPNNVFTLWVREDISLCGKFNPRRSDMQLVDQLLDSRPMNLLHGMGTSYTQRESQVSADNSQGEKRMLCTECRLEKSKEEFSKTQLRKNERRRCKSCVEKTP